ncbi:MAG: hypothetical protein V4689_08460 [Verrucomicrobiota bacterium]
MQTPRQPLAKMIVLIGAFWLVILTLYPPRCTVDSQGQVTRETSAFLYSRMFHSVERPMPPDGSNRQFVDRNGKVWQTSDKYDPAELDWTRYILGTVLVAVITSALTFVISAPNARKDGGDWKSDP